MHSLDTIKRMNKKEAKRINKLVAKEKKDLQRLTKNLTPKKYVED